MFKEDVWGKFLYRDGGRGQEIDARAEVEAGMIVVFPRFLVRMKRYGTCATRGD